MISRQALANYALQLPVDLSLYVLFVPILIFFSKIIKADFQHNEKQKTTLNLASALKRENVKTS